MKNLYPYNKFINEGVRDKMTPKSEEEIEVAIKNDFRRMMNEAEKKGRNTSRIGYLGDAFKYIQEYVLADGFMDTEVCYLLYNDVVYKMENIPGGDDYTMVNKIPESIEELKVKLKEMLRKLN